MTIYKVKKVKSIELAGFLRSMNVGETAIISEKEFRVMSVYNACYRLKKEGYSFKCSAKRDFDGCKVVRLN